MVNQLARLGRRTQPGWQRTWSGAKSASCQLAAYSNCQRARVGVRTQSDVLWGLRPSGTLRAEYGGEEEAHGLFP